MMPPTLIKEFWKEFIEITRPWPEYVLAKFAYRKFQGYSHGNGRNFVLTQPQFLKELKELCPGINTRKMKIMGATELIIELPPLGEIK